jgi:tellurite resistance protein TerC
MTLWLWISLALVIVVLVCMDLALLTRRPRVVSSFEAAATVALWVLFAIAASFGVAWVYENNWARLESLVSDPIDNKNLDGHAAWLQFITCYVIELALSLDNIVVLVVLYAFFKVPREIVARALFWSVLIALVGRLLMIVGGAALLRHLPQFKWVLGVFLVISFIRVIVLPDERTLFDRAWYVRLVRRVFPVSDEYDGHHMITTTKAGGKRWAMTPLMLVVVVGGLLDVTFALDSVPALFSVTLDPFLAFAASTLAILSLRSIFLTVRSVVARLRYLKHAIALVLIYVAAKTFLADYRTAFSNPATIATLVVVVGAMAAGVFFSIRRNRAIAAATDEALRPDLGPTVLADVAGEQVAEVARKNLRKVAILIGGTFIVIVGIAIAPLPGPGPTVLVPIGLAILATEFVWARKLLETVKSGAFNLAERGDALVDRFGIWLIPAIAIAFWATGLAFLHLGARALSWPLGILHDHWPETFQSWPYEIKSVPWYTVLVILGSPFMPIAIWMWAYCRRSFKRRREARRNAETKR